MHIIETARRHLCSFANDIAPASPALQYIIRLRDEVGRPGEDVDCTSILSLPIREIISNC